jgi:RNA polymerase sigma-70 factor (ECF subfamily)
VPEPSRETLEAARRGEPRALERLIREQQPYIYSLALGVARNSEDAADILQEACIKLVTALPSYRAEARFTTWLYRLVVNVGLDLLRRRGQTVALDEEGLTERLPSSATWADPESAAERSDRAARVRAALDRLSTPQRVALTLQYFEDVRYEDIAEIMGLPTNTVKSHLRRGKEALARELADLAPSRQGAGSHR